MRIKNLHKLTVLGAVLAVSASFAYADTINGTYWDASASGITLCAGGAIDGSCSGNEGAIPSSIPSASTATATFTVSNPNGGALINFYNNNSDNNLFTFLETGSNGNPNGDTVNYLTVPANAFPSTNINDGLFQFTGTAELPAGWVINATHDDGINLYLSGLGEVITDGGPTSSALSSYTVGTGGNYSFVLDYAETNGAPAELVSNLTSAPEPSSLMLLGTGLLGAAGMLMRRRRSIV